MTILLQKKRKDLTMSCPKCSQLIDFTNYNRSTIIEHNYTELIINTYCFDCNSQYHLTFKLDKVQEID